MYNRFLKQYNEWFPADRSDTGNQDTKVFSTVTEVVGKNADFTRDSSELRGLLASTGAIPPKVGKKYTNDRNSARRREIRHIPGVDGSSENSEEGSYTRRSPSRMGRAVDGTDCTCPSCGAVGESRRCLKAYCHTRFLMQDLYPKVANFYSIEDLSYSREEKRSKEH